MLEPIHVQNGSVVTGGAGEAAGRPLPVAVSGLGAGAGVGAGVGASVARAVTSRSDTLREITARLRASVGADVYERYFDGQTRLSLVEGALEVRAGNGFLLSLLQRRFEQSLKSVAPIPAGATGPKPLRFVIDQGLTQSSGSGASGGVTGGMGSGAGYGVGGASMPAPTTASDRAQAARPADAGRNNAREVALHAAYRFENFLVSSSNQLAYAAAVRTAEHVPSNGSQLPALFIHGAAGNGKTHLLRATLSRFAEMNPRATVRYTTAEAFTNEFITAIRNGKVEQFRKAYRKLDLLCIDDVHFFSNKESTQSELLHTLDAIGLDGARIALASDEHPREIKKLSDKLVSRFMGSVVVRIDAPDAPLRERLVRHMSVKRGVKLDDAATLLIAERSAKGVGTLNGAGGSVRELEGLIIQIEAVHRLLPELSGGGNGTIGVALARRALGLDSMASAASVSGYGGSGGMGGGMGGGMSGGSSFAAARAKAGYATPMAAAQSVTPRDAMQSMAAAGARPVLTLRRPVTGELVVSEVCKALRVDVQEFMGKGRHKRVVLAREVTAHLCRQLTTLSYPEIARAMGRSNHSTIITAHKRFEKMLAGSQGVLAPELAPGHVGYTLVELTGTLGDQIRVVAGSV